MKFLTLFLLISQLAFADSETINQLIELKASQGKFWTAHSAKKALRGRVSPTCVFSVVEAHAGWSAGTVNMACLNSDQECVSDLVRSKPIFSPTELNQFCQNPNLTCMRAMIDVRPNWSIARYKNVCDGISHTAPAQILALQDEHYRNLNEQQKKQKIWSGNQLNLASRTAKNELCPVSLFTQRNTLLPAQVAKACRDAVDDCVAVVAHEKPTWGTNVLYSICREGVDTNCVKNLVTVHNSQSFIRRQCRN